jgi:hypothetical protein
VTNFLQKLMFWRSDKESEPAAPLPDSRPNDAAASDVSEPPDEEPYRADRPSSSSSEPETDFRKKLFDE